MFYPPFSDKYGVLSFFNYSAFVMGKNFRFPLSVFLVRCFSLVFDKHKTSATFFPSLLRPKKVCNGRIFATPLTNTGGPLLQDLDVKWSASISVAFFQCFISVAASPSTTLLMSPAEGY